MAGKTEYLDLSGKCKWVNGRTGGLFTEDPEYGGYKLNFYPDQEAWDKLKKVGLELKSRNDEDGDYIILKRPHQKLFQGERKATYFGPPKVFFVEGIKPTKDIGNGSSVTINIAVYQAGRFKGHRLNEVIVTDLVSYERTGPARDNLVELVTEGENPEEPETQDDGPPFDVEDKGKLREDKIPFGDAPEEKTVSKSVNPFKKRG